MIFFGLIYLFKENQIFISINVYSYESAWVLEAEVFHYLCATMSFFHRYFGWFWSIESEEIRLLLLLTGHLLVSCFVTLLHFLANLLYAWYPIKFAFNVIEPQKNEELKEKSIDRCFSSVHRLCSLYLRASLLIQGWDGISFCFLCQHLKFPKRELHCSVRL